MKRKAVVQLSPKKKTTEEEQTPRKSEENKKATDKKVDSSRKTARKQPVVQNNKKSASPKNTAEALSVQSSPEGTKLKNRALKRKQATPETKCNEVTITEDISKPEASVLRQETAKKYSSKKQSSSANLVVEEAKPQTVDDPQKEKAVDDSPPQTTRRDPKIRRLSQYQTLARASDLITLLACAKEVIGDHEYSSDQD